MISKVNNINVLKKINNFQSIIVVFLFAIYPILFLVSVNIEQVTLEQVVPLFLLTVGLAFTIFFLLKSFFKNKNKQSIATVLFLLIFWNLGSVHLAIYDTTGLRYRYFLLVVIGLYILFLWFLRKTNAAKIFEHIISILFLPILLLTAMNLMPIFSNLKFVKNQPNLPEKNKTYLNADSTKAYPNIYLIILDEFANFGTIKREWEMELDDASFFEENNFFFAENSSVRYHFTNWSVPTLLNLDYLTGPVSEKTFINYTETPEQIKDIQKKKMLNQVSTKMRIQKWGDNFLMRYLKDKGYHITIWEGVSFHESINFSLADEHQGPNELNSSNSRFLQSLSNPLTQEILAKSAVFTLFNKIYEQANFSVTREIFHYLKHKALPEEQPNFVLAHILSPHRPIVFDKQGQFSTTGSDAISIHAGYLNQYLYILKELKRSIEEIQEREHGEAVIIIQSDHGPRASTLFMKDATEAFNIFNAIYFPDKNYQDLYDTIGQPNTMRVLLNKFFKENYKMLEDK